MLMMVWYSANGSAPLLPAAAPPLRPARLPCWKRSVWHFSPLRDDSLPPPGRRRKIPGMFPFLPEPERCRSMSDIFLYVEDAVPVLYSI